MNYSKEEIDLENLESRVEEALEEGDDNGDHWNVVFLENNRVLKVASADTVTWDIVDENISLAQDYDIPIVETINLSELFPNRPSQIQERGKSAVDFIDQGEDYELSYVDQVVDILDYVALETPLAIDAKMENFVIVEGNVRYCDLGDGASICRMSNDHMYDKFLASYRHEAGREFIEADTIIDSLSSYYSSKVAEVYRN